MRRERGVASDAFVALYQGSLGLAYDFDPLLDSARHLASDPSIIVVIVGTGTQRAHIERRVRSEHLTNVRMFDPNSPDSLSDSLAMGDVHLVSSRAGWNGVSFPSKVISALACGRPVGVIGPRDSEIATMVCEKRCGFVALDGPALADGIKRLKADATEVSRQRRVARATYESRFDREGALVQWDRLLLSMFADGRLAGLVDHGTDWNDTTERVESQ
ncbi:MAG TPA: glycosyltransferase [Polyangiaceae bacterium]|nr:glycosyltransferase [Polyangiaceae bacterium]